MANVTPRPYRTSDLKTRISNLAQTSVYQVKLQPPAAVFNFLRENGREFDYGRQGEDLELLCKNAVLPGSASATHDVTNDYAGVSVDQNRNMYKSRYANYRMSYPNDYRSEIYLTKFEKDVPFAGSRAARFVDPKQLQYTFVGAFPESIASTPVSYDGSSLLEVNVTMSYIRYVRERKNVPVATTGSNFDLVNNIFNFFT